MTNVSPTVGRRSWTHGTTTFVSVVPVGRQYSCRGRMVWSANVRVAPEWALEAYTALVAARFSGRSNSEFFGVIRPVRGDVSRGR
jgi:hypothetical protein